ncbi:hypothetical protein GEOBRER4_n2766 [Citrifermentans bremense]|uniref:Uncharacterized protein n=1 Tax=Citrifermentans bremense TaxID=60035 RepID=A0A6S6M8Y5_9BACT|nr:BREX system ATP-binding domain-containing protein [Citrifermentans bremense]BCG47915.1 hypothetical protein GEOBRER4_n2766 [Citrifermentans bremense]
MAVEISRANARQIRAKLMSAPVAPGSYAPFINAGTEKILSVLEQNYFCEDLAEGVSCFKYLEGDYGSGKTQFIQSLAERADHNQLVSAIVNIGVECPFNSPLAIFKSIMASFVPPRKHYLENLDDKGIEVLLRAWVVGRLCELGWNVGEEVPDMARRQVEQNFTRTWHGPPDQQMAYALMALGKRTLDWECGADESSTDRDLRSWVRGENVRSKALKEIYGLHEPARDETAFRRLKTVVKFLRTRLGFKGFFIAFDEGTRTSVFRRGSVKQKQAIENMLSMINENAEGEFGGVMFMYAATPDFRSDVIQNYQALNDRIGSVAFVPGRPMTPLIELQGLNSDAMIREIGIKLYGVFAKADGIELDDEVQLNNIDVLVEALKNLKYYEKVPPRDFVYNYCRLLDHQKLGEASLSPQDAEQFVKSHEIPETEDEE